MALGRQLHGYKHTHTLGRSGYNVVLSITRSAI